MKHKTIRYELANWFHAISCKLRGCRCVTVTDILAEAVTVHDAEVIAIATKHALVKAQNWEAAARMRDLEYKLSQMPMNAAMCSPDIALKLGLP